MTDFLKKLKKLIISNKYSLLVLLILALWLRLAKDYSVILSYVVLIILYLAIGMIVGFVLELLDSKSKKDEPVEESVRPSKRNVVTKPAVSNRERIPSHHDEIRSHRHRVAKHGQEDGNHGESQHHRDTQKRTSTGHVIGRQNLYTTADSKVYAENQRAKYACKPIHIRFDRILAAHAEQLDQ